jgi:hypothetical protein
MENAWFADLSGRIDTPSSVSYLCQLRTADDARQRPNSAADRSFVRDNQPFADARFSGWELQPFDRNPFDRLPAGQGARIAAHFIERILRLLFCLRFTLGASVFW